MNIKVIRHILCLFTAHLLLSGCTSIEQTIYLGDVEVRGPISPPPTHINVHKEVGGVTFSPRFSMIKSNTNIVGSTDDRYTRTFNLGNGEYYKAKTENLNWSISKYVLGIDLDIKASEDFSLFGGFHYTFADKDGLAGGNAGLGFHSHKTNPVIRLDLGVTFQATNFNAITIVHTKESSIFGNEEYWNIFEDKASNTSINPFITLTINSSDSGFINWFFPMGYFTQNLLGYEPSTEYSSIFPFSGQQVTVDTRSDMPTGFIYFNPGLGLSLNKNIKVLFSAKTMLEILATNGNKWFVMPSVQLDFTL